jgi:UPF0755 protein
MIKNKTRVLYKLALLGFFISAVWLGDIVFLPQSIANSEYRLVISKNEHLNEVAKKLADDNIVKSSWMFLLLLKSLGYDKKVNAGMYIFKQSVSLWALVSRITHGKPDQISIVIAEGITFGALKEYIDSLADIKHFTATQSEANIRAILKIPYANLEGIFYPDTYFIVPGQSDLEVYQHAYRRMQLQTESLYLTKESVAVVKSPYELLILASLIQKETGKIDDMVLVSTVFNNRLRVGMKLQNDPAVFYGLRQKDKIVRKDFLINTPYNTYLHSGLPPTPICIPSLSALKAASKPESNPELLYFVAIGNGKTRFTDSYKEHKKVIKKYLKQ